MTLDAYQRTRLAALRPMMTLIAEAPSVSDGLRWAAKRCGYSPKRLEAMYRDFCRMGTDALIDRRKLPKSKERVETRITGEERQLLRQYALRCDSFQLAIEHLADSGRCSEELAEIINRHRAKRTYPKWLRSAAQVSAEERDLARGHKTFTLRACTQLRKNTYIDAAGVEHALTAGDLFECDDMSLNQPYYYEWPYGGDKLSDKFGIRLGRQMLAAIDVATGKWLGFDLIGRVRDAYRAEDVVRFLGRIGSTHGLPRLGFRLEKGVWAAKSVRGVRGTTDDGERERIASIRDVVDIFYVHSSIAKGLIEGSFDHLQSFLSFSGITIGRKRGEYERTTQMMLACANGSRHPADCGFPHISEIADSIAAAMAKADARPKMGRLLKGIPQEKWDADITAEPLSPIPEESMHLFLPVRQIRPIDKQFVRCKVPHYKHQFSFLVPGEYAHLGRGYDLLVCFDPAAPHEGARVFDAEPEGRRQFGAKEHQSYGVWAYKTDAPQLDFSKTDDRSGRREYLAAARTHFRATGMTVGTGASIDQVQDGKGNSATIARGSGSAATPAPNQRAEAAMQARRRHAAGGERAEAARQAERSAAQFGTAITRPDPSAHELADDTASESWDELLETSPVLTHDAPDAVESW